MIIFGLMKIWMNGILIGSNLLQMNYIVLQLWGGAVVWIVGDATVDGSETGTSFKQALYFKDIGFKLHDTMIWQKIAAFQSKNRYIPDFEYMFVLAKGTLRTANIIQDRQNKWAGTGVHGTERQQSGICRSRTELQKSKVVKEYGVRFNIWDMPPKHSNTTGHPAPFPIPLVRDHIISWSNEGDTILDPFMGSGTTGVACIETNRNFIGIEINPKYFEIAKQCIYDIQNEHKISDGLRNLILNPKK